MLRVLVVEDEPDLRALVAMVLQLEGYDVSHAPHGAAALELIATHGNPNVVVTDRMMPVMGGDELVQTLRADPHTAAIPILMVTATPPQESPVPVLRKPYDFKVLAVMVAQLAAPRGVAGQDSA